MLGGEAGVGKSRLLAELRDRAQDAGWSVLVGHCVDFGDGALPYLPFSEAFGRLAADAPDTAKALVQDSSVIARLLPARRTLDGPRNDGDASEPIDRAALFEAVQRTLVALAQDAPLLLIIEDVHWADVSTRELLTFLLTRRSAEPIAIVASYRSDDLNRRHPLRATLAEWHRLPTVTRLHVEEALEGATFAVLIAGMQPGPLPERDVQRIVQRAEGNPFFAEELVSAAEDGGCSLPTELADLLLVRLDRLDADGRLVVRAASVAGRRVPHDLLARVSGLGAGELDLALRAAVEANVLVSVGGDGYLFRHALLAEAVYDDLLPGERVRLHAAYAKTLAARHAPGTAAELARHALAAHDLVTAARAGVRAGDEAIIVVGRPDEASAPLLNRRSSCLADQEVAAAVEAWPAVTIEGHRPGRPRATGHRGGHLGRPPLSRAGPRGGPAPRPAGRRARRRCVPRFLQTLASTALLMDTKIDVLALTSEAMGLVPADPPSVRRAQPS